jgi:hypothetical protein
LYDKWRLRRQVHVKDSFKNKKCICKTIIVDFMMIWVHLYDIWKVFYVDTMIWKLILSFSLFSNLFLSLSKMLERNQEREKNKKWWRERDRNKLENEKDWENQEKEMIQIHNLRVDSHVTWHDKGVTSCVPSLKILNLKKKWKM